MADYSTLLRDRVTLTVRSVDRIFLQGYVPHLQTPGWCARYLREQRGFGYPSSRAFGEVGKAYEKAIRNFAEENAIPVIRFAKGDSREEIARPYLDAAAAAGGKGTVALIGVGQEKASAWRSWTGKRRDYSGRPLQEWGRQMTFVNHFYFYLWDAEWGPAFWKVNCYAPFPVWIWLNGHEWAKRQLDKAGIGYAALDNGFRSCDKPALLQRLCDRLGPGAVSGFFWRWFPRLPQVFTAADLRAGYVYELAFRQFEVADTRVFSRPAAGRAFFEGLIRDHLDVGRPDCVSLTFGRRVLATTPGAFRTKVVTEGVDPQVSCYYKASRIKQYFKGHRALRTETVICDTRDFGIGRRVCLENWNALRAVGEHANQRLCDAEAADAQPAPDTVTFAEVTRPTTTAEGLHAPALRFGDPRVMAVLAATVRFTHLIAGFDNRSLTELVSALTGAPYTSRHATYDLRRLRRKQIIERLPGTHRYRLTTHGRAIAVLFTKTYGRVLTPGLTGLSPGLPSDLARRSPLATAWRQLDHALDQHITAGLAAA
jgi:hypothetical protein